MIEPWLTDQWYVDAETLAQAADAAQVREWADRYCPEVVGKNLLQLDGEYPALVCVAPAVVGAPDTGLVWANRKLATRLTYSTIGDDKCFVAATPEERLELAANFYGKRIVVAPAAENAMIGAMRQAGGFEDQDFVICWEDEDVLDTWFSSALWPFGTLGWPEGEARQQNTAFASSEVEMPIGRAQTPGVSTSLDTNGKGGGFEFIARPPLPQ